MNNKINLIILTVCFLAFIFACKTPQPDAPKTDTGVFANRAQLERQIENKIGKRSDKWVSVEFRKVEKNALTIYLHYAQMPASMREVERDTNRIAQAALDALREMNYDAQKEWLALFVHAQRAERGASGANMVRSFGKTAYDFNSDSLTFTEKK